MRTYLEVETPWRWVQIDRRGKLVARGTGETLDALQLPDRGGELIGVVPGETVTTHRVNIPSRRRRKVEAAAPYALEESLSEDIDVLHFALLHWVPGETASVAVVSRAQLACWLDDLAAAGIRLDALVADYLLVPLHPQAPVTLARAGDDRICIRTGAWEGVAGDTKLVDYWWQSIDDKSTPVAVNDPRLARTLIEAGGDQIREWPIGNTLGDWLAHHRGEPPIANLLNGDYTPAHRRERSVGFKIAATVFGIALLFKVVFDSAEYVYLSKKSDRIDAHIARIFKWTFPEVTRIIDPRAQMARQMQGLLSNNRARGDFAVLLDAVAGAVRQAQPKVESLSFHDNELIVSCAVANFADLDRLQTLFASRADVSAALLSSGARANRVSGRFKLTLGGT